MGHTPCRFGILLSVASNGPFSTTDVYYSCSRNVRIVPDFPSLDDVAADFSADILMLPGGASGAAAFCTSQAVLQLVATSRQRGKWIAAICAGTTALVASGMDKVTVTSHPSVKNEIQDKQWNYSDSRIVVDSQVITSRGYVLAKLSSWVLLLPGKHFALIFVHIY